MLEEVCATVWLSLLLLLPLLLLLLLLLLPPPPLPPPPPPPPLLPTDSELFTDSDADTASLHPFGRRSSPDERLPKRPAPRFQSPAAGFP